MSALRIAIVDDSPDMRVLFRRELDRSPAFEVCADGEDGAAAIDIARRLSPDVMLLDLSMPGMGGLEALPLILAASPGTRVIVLSGFGRRGFAEKAYAAGACGFVEKPTPAGTLAERLLEAVHYGPDGPPDGGAPSSFGPC